MVDFTIYTSQSPQYDVERDNPNCVTIVCRLCVFVCVQDRLLISQVPSKDKYLALSTNEILISINWSFEPNGLAASIFLSRM